MRIAVFGTGGVGGYFGGRLAQAGEDVVFIARGEHLRALQTQGLRVDSIKGDFVLPVVQATDEPAAVGPVDMVLLATKAWQVPEAAAAMHPLLDPDSAAEYGRGVVFLGNGVDAPAQLTAELGASHVLGGRCNISAFIAGPGHIRHVGVEPRLAFGELDGAAKSYLARIPRVERLAQAFERAGVEVSIPDDIQASIWEKFIFIASISGVGAVTRAPAEVLRSLPERSPISPTRRMLQDAIAEVENVARALRINLPGDISARTLAFIDNLTPGVIPSMQRDIMDGRPSELEAQTGAVVRLGLETGVPTPTHTMIYASLLPQEIKARAL